MTTALRCSRRVMDYEKACEGTRTLFIAEGPPEQRPEDPSSFEHLRWALDQIPLFAQEGNHLKANRWLGFVQGALAAEGVPLEKLKEVNADALLDEGPAYLQGLRQALHKLPEKERRLVLYHKVFPVLHGLGAIARFPDTGAEPIVDFDPIDAHITLRVLKRQLGQLTQEQLTQFIRTKFMPMLRELRGLPPSLLDKVVVSADDPKARPRGFVYGESRDLRQAALDAILDGAPSPEGIEGYNMAARILSLKQLPENESNWLEVVEDNIVLARVIKDEMENGLRAHACDEGIDLSKI